MASATQKRKMIRAIEDAQEGDYCAQSMVLFGLDSLNDCLEPCCDYCMFSELTNTFDEWCINFHMLFNYVV